MTTPSTILAPSSPMTLTRTPERRARVYILHPYRGQDRPGERAHNLKSIVLHARYITLLGMVPISPIHCMGFLDDQNDEDRKAGLALCRPWIEMSDMVWAYVLPQDHVDGPPETFPSEGCRLDHAVAVALGKRIMYLWYHDLESPEVCETPGTSV